MSSTPLPPFRIRVEVDVEHGSFGPQHSEEEFAKSVATDLIYLSLKLIKLQHSFDYCLVADVFGVDMIVCRNSNLMDVYMEWFGNGRNRTYACEFCNKISAKDRWGPGRIRCPRCGLMAKTADGSLRGDR